MEGKLEHMDHNLNILVYICYIVIFDIGRMSHVTCHVSQYIYIYILIFLVELVAGGSVINGAYPVYFLIFFILVDIG